MTAEPGRSNKTNGTKPYWTNNRCKQYEQKEGATQKKQPEQKQDTEVTKYSKETKKASSEQK